MASIGSNGALHTTAVHKAWTSSGISATSMFKLKLDSQLTRIMLEHLSDGVSMKRRKGGGEKRRREGEKEEGKKGGGDNGGAKKGGGEEGGKKGEEKKGRREKKDAPPGIEPETFRVVYR